MIIKLLKEFFNIKEEVVIREGVKYMLVNDKIVISTR